MTVTADHGTASRVRTIRMFDATWDEMESRTPGLRSDPSKYTRDMTEAGLGFARCFRCFEPVPVEFGDVTGKPLAEWVAEAGRIVTAQHRDGHHPVTVGRTAASRTGAAGAIPAVAPVVAPATAVFLEPGGKPVITAPVPEVPARSKKGRRL